MFYIKITINCIYAGVEKEWFCLQEVRNSGRTHMGPAPPADSLSVLYPGREKDSFSCESKVSPPSSNGKFQARGSTDSCS